MEKKAQCIELKTADGRPFLKLYVYEDVVPAERKDCKENKQPKGEQNDDPMTSAQKRYLFRILADQSLEGDKAHDKLKSLFQVNDLKEVSKLEASRMIERLLEENKGGDKNAAGAPFQ